VNLRLHPELTEDGQRLLERPHRAASSGPRIDNQNDASFVLRHWRSMLVPRDRRNLADDVALGDDG
jgi:hypothetical protein